MKRSHVLATIGAFALAVCTAAAQSTSPQDPYGQSSKNQNHMVTVTGCLSSGSGASSTSTTGTSGSTSASSAVNAKWILNNASFGSGSAPGTSGSTTTSSSANNAAASSSSYTLVGHEKDLQKYANAKVEVRGTIEGAGASSTSSGSYGSSTAGSSTSGETLRVSSVRKIADRCQ